MSITTSKELFINMKDIPEWNPRKPYYEQSKDVLDFFSEERKKLIYGTNIGGFFVHPLLYWHINYFKTPIPIREKGVQKEVIMVAPLDDNIMYITDTYQQAEKEDKGMCVFGTRGFTKSTFIGSLASWLGTTKENGAVMIVGGNDDDLGVISSMIQTGVERVHPAFHLPRLKSDWKSEVEFGMMENDRTKIIHSRFDIRNADSNKKSSSEKGAGQNPVGFVADEIGKWEPIKLLQSAIPSFMTPHGAKLVHFLSGTGGNTELSKDAKTIMQNPEEFRLLMLNRDRLDRGVPEEALTWKDTKDKDFCTFVPAQMSYRLKVLKIPKKLSEYVGVKNSDLDKIKVMTTDWVGATKKIYENRSLMKKEESINKDRMYYPLRTDDCFLVESVNPFPSSVISRHIEFLETTGKVGKNVTLYREGTEYKYEFSNKKKSQVSHGGGVSDAPTIIFEEIPKELPQKYLYVGGHDGYKLDVSDTDSLGAHYIIKRRNMSPNEPCETISCSYTTRPEKMRTYLQGCEIMTKAWNAMVNMESIDAGFQHHLENKGIDRDYLCPAFSFTQKTSRSKTKLNSKYGLFPNSGNNTYRFNSLVDWAWEEHTIGLDAENNPIIKYSVEFIDDIDLLKEMLDYKKGNNVDRITAFSHALVYAQELDKDKIMPDREKKTAPTANELQKRAQLTRNSRYSGSKYKKY